MTALSIAFLTPSLSREAGGIFEVERNLAQHLVQLPDVRVEAYGTTDAAFAEDACQWPPIAVHAFPYRGPQQFRWSPQLQRAFDDCQADVAHLHVLWMHTSLVMRRWARVRRRPYVTTLHGMLDAWALQNSRWKKRFCGAVYERSCLAKAGCLHAFSESELASARAYGLKNPVCLIPNGVTLPELTLPAPNDGCQRSNGKRTLLYLSRIHPKKGLVNLLHAWHNLRARASGTTSDWTLKIAGWDQGGHESELQALTAELGIEANVQFLGPLFGDDKTAAYRDADAFVLPSFSEGLPMVVLEAWAHAKPVLMTPQCNLPEGFTADAAICAQPETGSLTEGLTQIVSASDAQRAEMGRRGLELVKQRFTWTKVAAEMHDVYRWLVGGGAAPQCVVRN